MTWILIQEPSATMKYLLIATCLTTASITWTISKWHYQKQNSSAISFHHDETGNFDNPQVRLCEVVNDTKAGIFARQLMAAQIVRMLVFGTMKIGHSTIESLLSFLDMATVYWAGKLKHPVVVGSFESLKNTTKQPMPAINRSKIKSDRSPRTCQSYCGARFLAWAVPRGQGIIFADAQKLSPLAFGY